MEPSILDKELTFKTSRSSGSGGQHVNKTETRVELRFDLDASGGLTNSEQRRIRKALGNRISQAGILTVASSNRRSQVLNKKEAVKKFYRLLKKALRRRPRRKGPKPLKANPAKRLRDKKKHAEKKALRGKVEW
ncbi:MAG: aminoacyl-tRNA hydrolase [Bacteroidetes bacterium]|jgi:ribosome-associated protein|nr:aminoacyl-tRNA hydrolase [Bacteroidota bacterium]